jgi:hypothetical protein
MRSLRYALSGAVVLSAMAAGCAPKEPAQPAQRSNLTAGMAKKTIVKGQTTEAEVLEVFGPPDLVTHRDDLQIWTYDKVRYDVENSGGYLTVGVAGMSGGGSKSSSTATMLIIYFDNKDVVRDYRLNVTRF